MKTEKIDLPKLRNDEHFQFNTEFRDAILRFGADTLKIGVQFEPWLLLYAQEDESLKKIMKSAITAEIQEADQRRDQLFGGMVDASKAALRHFRPEVQQAARRIKIVLDTYGNLARKPLNEQTSGVYNILQDLNGRYAADASTTGLKEWMDELQAANEAFDRLMKDRYEESALKTDLVLKQVRQQADEQYRLIIERINALVTVEGDANYAEFIRYLNIIIAKYTTIVAQRAGKAAGRKKRDGEQSPAEE